MIALGDLYLEAGRQDDASKSYKAAQRISKASVEADLGMAKLKIAETSVSRSAVHKAKRACALLARNNRTKSTGNICSGQLWLSMDRSARAVEDFQKAISKGDIKRGETGMGDALRLRADYAAAISSYEKAIEAGAGYTAQIGLGLSLESKGDVEGARKALLKAVESQPASCAAHLHYGRVLARGPEALSHLKTALEIRPGWIDALVSLGDVYFENGEYASSAEYFTKAIEAKAPGGDALLGLGKALHLMGQDDEAKEALEKAIEVVPNLVDAHLALAEIHSSTGNHVEAIDSLEKAQSFSSGDAGIYFKTGETYYRIGRHTTARSFLTKAISLKQDMSKAYVILGHIACERKLYDSGQSYYASALAGDMVGVDKKDIESRKAACKSK